MVMEKKKLTSNHNSNSNERFHYNSTIPRTNNIDTLTRNAKHQTTNFISERKQMPEHSYGSGNNSEATEMTKLRPRTAANNVQLYTSTLPKPSLPDDVVYLEREVLPSDSLQSFALLYGCTINDIKRANNLIKEQDFHALRLIKIPVKRHGLLTEPEEEQKRRPIATTELNGNKTLLSKMSVSNDVYHNLNEEIDSGDSLESRNLLRSTEISFNPDLVDKNDTTKFLKNMDKEIRKTVRKNGKLENDTNETLKEVVSSLGSIGYRSLPIPGSRPAEECNGADWGVKWWVLLLCFIAVLIAAIFVGIEYYLNHKQFQTSTPVSGSSTLAPKPS